MNAKRWTLGVVLAATVSLWGLVEADASPFASYILSDDLGNLVRGAAPEVSGSETDEDWVVNNIKDNNGHGNNEDGVDSSNKGQGSGGPNGGVDESCPEGPEGGACVDDEGTTSGGKKK